MDNSPAHGGMQPGFGKPGGALAFGETLLRYAINWIDERRYVERHRRYIEDLDRCGELDGLLEAIGVTRDQLAAFALSPLASAELLTGVMARVGLGGADLPNDAGSADTPEMRCRTCESWRQCRRWLESGAMDDGYREFCPNAALFDRLRVRTRPT